MAAIAVHPYSDISTERQLEGRIALVTGASRGIGRAIATELAHRGASVAVNYKTNARAAEEVRCEIRQLGHECELFQGDVSNCEHARRLIREVHNRFHRIDILVNNAGITRDRSIRKLSDEDWAEVIETNLNSVFYCTRAALPVMMEQKYGRIVNIASFIGQAGNFGQVNYAASKGGVIAMTKALALELARYNITANVVAPGFTETEMVATLPPDIMQQILGRIPLKRLARPDEVAKAVAFLLCDGDYITGQQINVNGGIYM
jgi:acetoacetyl-CoA reductase